MHPLSRALVLVVERVHAQEKKRNAAPRTPGIEAESSACRLTSSGYNCHRTKPFLCAPLCIWGIFASMRWCEACPHALTSEESEESPSLRGFADPPPPAQAKKAAFSNSRVDMFCTSMSQVQVCANGQRLSWTRYPVLFCTVVHARCGRLVLRTVKYCR